MDNKIFTICDLVRNITDEEIQECRAIANEQINWTHPFKHAFAKWQHDLGEYNHRVIDAVINLKSVIDSGADLEL